MNSVYNQFSLLHFYWLSFGEKIISMILFFMSLYNLLTPHLMVRFRGGHLCLHFYKNYTFSQQITQSVNSYGIKPHKIVMFSNQFSL